MALLISEFAAGNPLKVRWDPWWTVVSLAVHSALETVFGKKEIIQVLVRGLQDVGPDEPRLRAWTFAAIDNMHDCGADVKNHISLLALLYRSEDLLREKVQEVADPPALIMIQLIIRARRHVYWCISCARSDPVPLGEALEIQQYCHKLLREIEQRAVSGHVYRLY